MPINNYYGLNGYSRGGTQNGADLRDRANSRGFGGNSVQQSGGLSRLQQGGRQSYDRSLSSVFGQQLSQLGRGQGTGVERGLLNGGSQYQNVQLQRLRRELVTAENQATWFSSRIERYQGINDWRLELINRSNDPRYRRYLQSSVDRTDRLIQAWRGQLEVINSRITSLRGQIDELTGNPNPNPNPGNPVALSASQQAMLNSTFAADADGRVRNGHHVFVVDGASADGVLSPGDKLQVLDGNNSLVSTHDITAADIYAERFRENMRDTAASLTDGGWRFSEKNVEIPRGKLRHPESRPYTDSYGVSGTEKVLQRNDYWEIVERGGNRFMLMRERDNWGNPVRPADAVNHIFSNRRDYHFDCATPMRVLNLKATMDTIGADDFNTRAGRLQINSWFDQHDFSSFDGGFRYAGRTAAAGEVSVDGVPNLAGEYALFDPSRGDKMVLGNTYYFDKPGDNTSSVQGWNAVFIGKRDADTYKFWTPSLGIANVHFHEGQWIPDRGFDKYYLASAVGSPDVARLGNWDSDRSGLV